MSSPATAAFLQAARSSRPQFATLATIELTRPSARTLYIATALEATPDGQLWEDLIAECEDIVCGGGMLASGPNPITTSITLKNRRLAFQTSGTVLNMLATHAWVGAMVTIYQWDRSLTDFSTNRLQQFRGRVNRPAEITVEGVKLYLIQDRGYARRIPVTRVDKIVHPNSPEASQGLPIPVVYGDHKADGMRTPWSNPYTFKDDHEDSGAGSGVVPGVVVDKGVGAADVKVVFASHALMELLDRPNGYTAFIRGADVLNPLLPGSLTESLGSTESYLTIADESIEAYAAVLPVDVRTTAGNTALDPRNAMDPFDETSFAGVYQGSSNGTLQLILPTAPNLGRIESVEVVCAMRGRSGNGGGSIFRIRQHNPGTGPVGTAVTDTAQNTTPKIVRGTWDPFSYNANAWDFGGSGTGTYSQVDIRIDFTSGASNEADVFWVALVVRYRPQRSLVIPGFIDAGPFLGTRGITNPYTPINNFERALVAAGLVRIEQPKFLFEGLFFANVKGYADDGSGTYTGTIGALIERAPDILRHVLVTYGGQHATNDFVTAGSTFGSFVDVRAALRNASDTDFKLAVHIGQRTDVQDVVSRIAAQSLMFVYLDRITNDWMAHAWKLGAQRDYDRVLRWEDMLTFEVSLTSDTDVVQSIRVQYGYDHFKNRCQFEAFVTPEGSTQGYTQPTVRDQKLTITSPDDDMLDWSFGASTYADVITGGDYDHPLDLAEEIRTQMRTHQAVMHCGWGFSIRTGYNDKIDFSVGGTPYVATLAEADYTAEGLCIEAARAMNAVPGHGLTFTVTYSHSTNQFTIAATGNFGHGAGTGANYATSALMVMGFHGDLVSAASDNSDFARYADRFWWGRSIVGGGTNFQLLWATGANATANCALVIGATRDADHSPASTNYSAPYIRGVRELLAETSADPEDGYGERPERAIVAEWIRSESVAVQLRNRIADFLRDPRVVVVFRTTRCPDMQRMRVIEFSDEFDDHVPYPGADGSWEHKVFRVVQVTVTPGTWEQEIVAVAA